MKRWLSGFRRLRRTGPKGERLAKRHLKQQGYRVLAVNDTTRLGEIDLIALSPDRQYLVIIEVKTADRASGQGLLPEWRVNRDKQRKLVALAAGYARRRRLAHLPIRFDVIGVTLAGAGDESANTPEIRHHVGAFDSPV